MPRYPRALISLLPLGIASSTVILTAVHRPRALIALAQSATVIPLVVNAVDAIVGGRSWMFMMKNTFWVCMRNTPTDGGGMYILADLLTLNSDIDEGPCTKESRKDGGDHDVGR